MSDKLHIATVSHCFFVVVCSKSKAKLRTLFGQHWYHSASEVCRQNSHINLTEKPPIARCQGQGKETDGPKNQVSV